MEKDFLHGDDEKKVVVDGKDSTVESFKNRFYTVEVEDYDPDVIADEPLFDSEEEFLKSLPDVGDVVDVATNASLDGGTGMELVFEELRVVAHVRLGGGTHIIGYEKEGGEN